METVCGPNKACELLQMLQQDNPIPKQSMPKMDAPLDQNYEMWILQHTINSSEQH